MSETPKELKENLETELESLQSELSTLEQEYEQIDTDIGVTKQRIDEIEIELFHIDSEGLEWKEGESFNTKLK